MKPSQPTLPGVRDWREPQTVAASQLVLVVAQANVAGFLAVRLEVLKPLAYRVTFQRMADASEGRNARPAEFEDATETHCPTCGTDFEGVECPICAPLARVRQLAHGNRQCHAESKARARHAVVSHVELSQPKERD
ncbi:MAG TPA: hypothetical protein VMV89_08315 [Candidatus Paceibacterota bacterium]|nr:hypothetical protein [Candidatus Paceibacterota bacterium]